MHLLLGFWFRALGVHRFELQFGAVRADRISFEVRQRVTRFVLRFHPAFDREKEILIDLPTRVLHSVTHLHRRKFLVQIDGQLLVFDRDIGGFLLVGRSGVARHRHAGLPRATVGKQTWEREQENQS